MRVTIETTLPQFAAKMARFGPAVERAQQRATEVCAIMVEQAAAKHFVPYGGVQRTSLSSMGLVRRRSGHLVQSLNHSKSQRDSRGWFATVGFRRGTVDAYAQTVEEGRTFTAKAKQLSIPIGEGLTPAGEARYRSPLQVRNGFWMSVRGLSLFVERVGNALRTLFVGKRQVTVKPFRPLRRSLDSQRPRFEEVYQRELKRAEAEGLRG